MFASVSAFVTSPRGIRFILMITMIVMSLVLAACGDGKGVGEDAINKGLDDFFQNSDDCAALVC